MKAIFNFNAQFCGRAEEEILVEDNITIKELKEKFKSVMGLEFDNNCDIVLTLEE